MGHCLHNNACLIQMRWLSTPVQPSSWNLQNPAFCPSGCAILPACKDAGWARLPGNSVGLAPPLVIHACRLVKAARRRPPACVGRHYYQSQAKGAGHINRCERIGPADHFACGSPMWLNTPPVATHSTEVRYLTAAVRKAIHCPLARKTVFTSSFEPSPCPGGWIIPQPTSSATGVKAKIRHSGWDCRHGHS